MADTNPTDPPPTPKCGICGATTHTDGWHHSPENPDGWHHKTEGSDA